MLADLSEQLSAAVLTTARLRELPRNQILFSQGDKSSAVYAVISGSLRLVQHTLDGQDVTLSVFAPGELIGLGVAVSGEDYPGACEASDDSEVLVIPLTTFRTLLSQHAPLSFKLLSVLVNRLHDAHERIRELSSERVERRIARAILRLANKVGIKTDTGIKIDMPLSRQDLAEMCGTTLHTASRILSEWQRAGLVDLGREQVTVTRPHDLVLIAEELNTNATSDHKKPT